MQCHSLFFFFVSKLTKGSKEMLASLLVSILSYCFEF